MPQFYLNTQEPTLLPSCSRGDRTHAGPDGDRSLLEVGPVGLGVPLLTITWASGLTPAVEASCARTANGGWPMGCATARSRFLIPPLRN